MLGANLNGDVTRFEHGADVYTQVKSSLTAKLVTKHWYARLEFEGRRQRLGWTE